VVVELMQVVDPREIILHPRLRSNMPSSNLLVVVDLVQVVVVVDPRENIL
jgi:hypothetical protein